MIEINNLASQSVRLAVENVLNEGGPFGCIIVRNGEIIATGVDRVTFDNDPTAHAEVMAIRAACTKLHTYQLDDCDLITSCEPCPMCMGAAYWARVKAVYYVATKADAASAGFDDSFIYEEMEVPYHNRKIPFIRVELNENSAPFEAWLKKENKKLY